MKMSDVFKNNLELTREAFEKCELWDGNEKVGTLEAEEDADSICEAVNNYDRLIEENKKLSTALKQLTDDDCVELMRCGIGSNYGGTFYDIKLNKLMIKVNSAKLLLADNVSVPISEHPLKNEITDNIKSGKFFFS